MNINDLEPKEVFRYFKEISDIPRPSYKEKAISDYLVAFAKEHNLECYQDAIYNVIMIKEATPGYENKEPIILQGHMDMVCEKTSDCTKDMEKEGLDLVVEGDWLSAEQTTLGGDDGIAVAFALALLSDETLKHPRLEFICTVSEEVGMDGARDLDVAPIKGKLLLNLDSEKEGEVLASCAGGGTARITCPVERTDDGLEDFCPISVEVVDGKGGHSGDEIDKGRGNATILLSRVLRRLDAKGIDFRITEITGGSKDNAIPREASAKIAVKRNDGEKVKALVEEVSKEISAEFSKTDTELKVVVKDGKTGAIPMTKESTKKLLLLISSLPNGIRRMSRDIEGLVETSLNLGITYTEETGVILGFSVRSSVASSYAALTEKLRFVAEGLGCSVDMHGEYPAWEFKKKSPLRDTLQRIYKDMFGKDLEVRAIHAGLECGLLSGKIPGLDAVSMGPDMQDIHTPDERLSISSTARTYEFVRRIIEEL